LSRFSDKIITPNWQIANFIATQEKIPIDKFISIPNPVSLPEKNEGIISNLKKEIRYENDKFYILNIGRFSEEKGQKFLIEAAEILLSKDINFKILFVGHGPLEIFLENYIKTKKLENFVSIVKEPLLAKYFLELSDIFVLSSVKEGQPIALMEAMKFGVPVIASSTDGSKAIIKDGVNGLLFKVGDVKKLAEQIEMVYKNKKLCNFLVENAKISVNNFSPEINIKKLEEIIQKSFQKNGKL
jgi:glycosyltransferase involved in cell wall biosynthesis